MRVFVSVAFVFLFALPALAQTQAEVIVPATFLRKSPNSVAEKVQEVQRGEKITLEKPEVNKGWYYVSILSGKIKGWINANTISAPAAGLSEPTPTPQKPTVSPSPAKTTPTPAPQKNDTVSEVTKPQPKSTPKPEPTPSPTEKKSSSSKPTKNPVVAAKVSSTPIVTKTPDQQAVAVNKPVPTPQPTPNVTDDNEVLRIDTEEVNLNVRVIDSNNRPVNNLNASQFQVFENNEPQQITSFTTAEIPTKYALVVDNSRSLRTQLEKVVEAGKFIISLNRPADESSVVRFVNSDKIEVVQDFTSNKSSLDNALNNLFVEGGQTAIIDAVYLTAKKVNEYEKSQKKDDFKRRALILVTDGDDRVSKYTEQQLVELLRQSEVQIYAIGFTGNLSTQLGMDEKQTRQEKARAFLTRIAQETGGKVYFPNSLDELPKIAADISIELRTQYLLTYAPTNEAKGESFRNIKVVIADGAGNEKRTAITRTGRTVTTAPEQSSRPAASKTPAQKPKN